MDWQAILIPGIPTLVTISVGALIYGRLKQQHRVDQTLHQQLLIIQDRLKQRDDQRNFIQSLIQQQQKEQIEQRQRFDEYQIKSLKLIQDSLIQNMQSIREQVSATLTAHAENLGNRVDKLTSETQERLKEISGQVDRKLTEGFEKTTETFTDVVKRLTIIDEAQEKNYRIIDECG